MNKSCIKSLLVAIVAGGLPSLAQASVVVYDNFTDYKGRFTTDNSEVGDQVVLAPFSVPAAIQAFSFNYWGANFDGNEQARVRFYSNVPANAAPGAVLYDSGLFSVPASAGVPNANRVDFTQADFGNGLVVPNTFTWSVQFSGIEAGESAGLDLFTPPTVGNSFTDYWFYNTSLITPAWELRGDAGSIDFGASFSAVPVPEPSAMFAGGGLALLVALRYRFNKAKAKA